MAPFLGRIGGRFSGSMRRAGLMRFQMSDCMALDLTIKIHIYHCEALVSTIEVVETVGLLIFIGFGGFLLRQRNQRKIFYVQRVISLIEYSAIKRTSKASRAHNCWNTRNGVHCIA